MSTLEKSIYVLLISVLPIIELRGAIPAAAALGLPFYIYAPLAVLGNLLPVPFILLFIPKILDLLERVRFLRPVVHWVREKARKGAKKILEGKKKDRADTSAAQPQDTASPISLTESVDETHAEGSASAIEEGVCIEESICAVEESICAVKEGADVNENANAPEHNAAFAKESEPAPKMTLGVFIALLLFVMIPLPGTGAWTGALVASLFELPKRHSFLSITLGVLGAAVIMTLASEGVLSIFRLFL